MADYVIGDVQGCFDALQNLLQRINFQPDQDHLIFSGDIINRGPQSLETLRFIHSLPNVTVTLGNHDLYFLALASQAVSYNGKHTLDALLQAPDCQELATWLRHQPLLYCSNKHQVIVTHAGILPTWSLSEAKARATELEKVLQSDAYMAYLQHMLGDTPNQWHDQLQGFDRLRFITNAFTRMRFTTADGKLELKTKSSSESPLDGFKKWFEWPRDLQGYRLCFGHFAAIMGQCPIEHIYALDTGCVWGYQLSALRLDDWRLFQSTPS